MNLAVLHTKSMYFIRRIIALQYSSRFLFLSLSLIIIIFKPMLHGEILDKKKKENARRRRRINQLYTAAYYKCLDIYSASSRARANENKEYECGKFITSKRAQQAVISEIAANPRDHRRRNNKKKERERHLVVVLVASFLPTVLLPL